ncbi:MAG: NADH:ubiquinone oxidoreductase subunit NDUFA12 [Pseudomonadota bacterium]
MVNIYEMGFRMLARWQTLRRRGVLVGEDAAGNRYYRDRKPRRGMRERRWVLFAKGESEASRVMPEWHGWLHHQTDVVPGEDNPNRRPWQEAYEPNQTGTTAAYLPPGHTLMGGKRPHATGDYEPWSPN